jgi:hypothetical protein
VRLVELGFGEMVPAYDAIETVILDRTLVHDGGAVLTWASVQPGARDGRQRQPRAEKQHARELDPAVNGRGLHTRTKPEDGTDRPFRGMTGDPVSGRVQPRQRRRERYAEAA